MSGDPLVASLQRWVEVSMRRSLRHFLLHARASGLSMSHFGAIFHLHRSGSCGVTEIGEHLGVSSAAASQMLERLVQQGLVLRAEDPMDRRVKRIELTDKGGRVFRESIRARQGWLEDLAGSLSDEERQVVTSALEILILKVDQPSLDAVSTK